MTGDGRWFPIAASGFVQNEDPPYCIALHGRTALVSFKFRGIITRQLASKLPVRLPIRIVDNSELEDEGA